MKYVSSTPTLVDLSTLGRQIEQDSELPVHELKQRDHAIGLQCHATNDVGRLLFWLNCITDAVNPGKEKYTSWLSEVSATNVMRILALSFGFIGMAGFLLTSEKALVNAFVFFLMFVLIQLLFCVVSSVVMLLSWLGNAPVVFPLNLSKYVVARAIPDMRYLRESQSVIRVLLLRYGQEFGAIFTFGAIMAFFTVLAFKDFTFVWGSTFNVSDEFVQRITTFVASPWALLLPNAIPSAQVIMESRYSPALSDLAQANSASMHGWWPFLIMAMLIYALLPRIILWAASRLMYVSLMRRSFVEYPGSAAVLLRMKSPLVTTQSLESEEVNHLGGAGIPLDDSLMLVNWAGALDEGDLEQYEEVSVVPTENVLSAGLDTLSSDQLSVERINEFKPVRLLVAVKAWEPPMGELQDFLDALTRVARCTLCLVPLFGDEVTKLQLEQWREFSRGLRFAAVDTQPLYRM